jgi:hypothetical protein
MVRLVTNNILETVLKQTRSHVQFFCRTEARRSLFVNQLDYIKLRETTDPDSYSDGPDTELAVMNHVSTYFEISSKRIIETIPMICDTSIALNLTGQMRKSFNKDLGVTGPGGVENSERFLEEDRELKERKRRLLKEEEILNRGDEILASVQR